MTPSTGRGARPCGRALAMRREGLLGADAETAGGPIA